MRRTNQFDWDRLNKRRSSSYIFVSPHRLEHRMQRKRYKVRNFVKDCIGVVLTGGLWFIWIVVRESRRQY